ncbi:hypothetical protein [Aquella oligotrophica]|uniref:HTH luxR-type domain-containing protein n=1 Tax=Aquella oligotrophica TaxID=2067065 RepID=A0A2I7N796_9NEIS|nr:hypothetical protein [Aquella oligotrophica]AUR52321.1 hypothetical protein CUN60_08440 [Aquella oligotrophica]
MSFISDEEYFNQYLKSFTLFHDGAPDIISFIKDNQFAYRGISKGFNQFITVNNVTIEIGQTDLQLNLAKEHPTIIQTIHDYNCQIRDLRVVKTFIYITKLSNLHVVRKYPIINPATNNFLGIYACFSKYVSPHPVKSIFMINEGKALINIKKDQKKINFELSERQKMVLYFYLHRYSYADISKIMSSLGHVISASRVNDHLSNLKYIFSVRSKQELLDKAFALNYHLCIPRTLLKLGVFEINEEIIVQ